MGFVNEEIDARITLFRDLLCTYLTHSCEPLGYDGEIQLYTVYNIYIYIQIHTIGYNGPAYPHYTPQRKFTSHHPFRLSSIIPRGFREADPEVAVLPNHNATLLSFLMKDNVLE